MRSTGDRIFERLGYLKGLDKVIVEDQLCSRFVGATDDLKQAIMRGTEVMTTTSETILIGWAD